MRPLADDQIRTEVETFALTANNIIYAAMGDAMRYWDFYPLGDAEWGVIPVWGFSTVMLFLTSWLIDDFLDDNAFFGTKTLLLSSASSKTA